MARMVFNPHMFESLETIQALIILSLWQGDGKVLIGMAASMAVNMQMPEASKLVSKLKGEGNVGPELDEAMERAKLVRFLLHIRLTSHFS